MANEKRRSKPRRTIKPAAVTLASSIFVVPFEGYHHDLLVCVGSSDDEVIAELTARRIDLSKGDRKQLIGKNGHDKCDFRAGCTMLLPDAGKMVMRLRGWNGSPFDHAHLAHETFHAVAILFEKIGIGLCHESDEAWAYAIGSLTEHVMTELRLPSSKRGAGR